MPTRLRSAITSMRPVVDVDPVEEDLPVRCATPSMRSFMRLRQRSSVDLPQPEGPMKAVTRAPGSRDRSPESAVLSPYQSDRLRI